MTAVLDLIGPSYPTPASFNSTLGVVRAINEGLQPQHQSFVVEMGAYRTGDISELCDLVHPRVGVLTAIGPAHLERFGSLDVTEQAKGELADALPAEGLFVTRADDERTRRIAQTRSAARTLLFGPAPHPDADVWAEDVRLRTAERSSGELGAGAAAARAARRGPRPPARRAQRREPAGGGGRRRDSAGPALSRARWARHAARPPPLPDRQQRRPASS